MNEKIDSKQGDWRDVALLIVFAIMLAFFAFVAMALQLVWPGYVSAREHFGCLLICTLFLVPFVLAGRFRPTKTILAGVFAAYIAQLWFFPTSSRQHFLRDLDRVQIGMTPPQVETIMGGYLKGTGWPANPFSASSNLTAVGSNSQHATKNNSQSEIEITNALTYRHSEEAEYNSDWGVVSFRNGRVTKTEFMPD